MAENNFEGYIADVIDQTNDLIEAAVDNFDETFKGVPFGAGSLDGPLFVKWFEEQIRKQGPNWVAFLAIEDSGEGQKAMARYEKLRAEGVQSEYAQPQIF